MPLKFVKETLKTLIWKISKLSWIKSKGTWSNIKPLRKRLNQTISTEIFSNKIVLWFCYFLYPQTCWNLETFSAKWFFNCFTCFGWHEANFLDIGYCLAFLTKTVTVRQQCFCCWWIEITQCKELFWKLLGWGVHKSLGIGTVVTADPNCPIGHSRPYGMLHSTKTWGQEVERGDIWS